METVLIQIREETTAWGPGDDVNYANIGYHFAKQGIVTVVISYRLTPNVKYPGGAEDIQAVREWIFNNISSQEYGSGSPEKVVLFGHSAGGAHIATNLYAAGDPALPKRDPLKPPVAGVIHLDVPFWFDSKNPRRAQTLREYFGSDADEAWQSRTALSLFRQLPDDSPALDSDKLPTYVGIVEWEMLSTADGSIWFLEAYRQKSKPAGTCPIFHVLKGHNHISDVLSIGTSDTAQADHLLPGIEKLYNKLYSTGFKMGLKLRVGILGAGEVAQVCHLPVLSLLSDLYIVTAICDISAKNVAHTAAKFHIPLATTNPQDIFQSSDVDVVFVLTSDEYHEEYAIAALQARKHAMVEKPLTLSIDSARRIAAAEAAAGGPRVFVGYMRRYAKSFTQTFKREVASIPRILYARSRDFSGPNSKFVNESGTFPVKNTDFPPEAGEVRAQKLDKLYREAFLQYGGPVTERHVKYCRFLGSLGSHDISLMREVLGTPDSVGGVSVNEPFYSAIFNYHNQTEGKEPFAVTYESGIDTVPEFDAHFAVYGEQKRVMIKYDSPYVKGLPIKVTVQELNEAGEMQTREMLGSYEDAYTAELRDLHENITQGREIKTSLDDAVKDLQIFDMMYRSWLNS
ncbi:hypothetical protein PRZ48_003448 [Zasmidium cellare]|uniref:Gfo/Idh/MocA-like oxidoreductase N-terminal domain-containing protein n=1 Tax=Zasmidium cellare TaxID=395010 RepID=A0ABR0EWM5_ZASCE|nr:hypothetical protein PRZ48_003448 [Zasmidium cellare]